MATCSYTDADYLLALNSIDLSLTQYTDTLRSDDADNIIIKEGTPLDFHTTFWKH